MLCALWDVKVQLGKLQNQVDSLITIVELKEERGVEERAGPWLSGASGWA